MKTSLYQTFFAFFILFFMSFAGVKASPTPFVSPVPPSIAGTAYYVTDYHSGAVITEKNADMKIEPASLTKIMTGYVVFNELKLGRLKLDDMVTISQKAWRMPGSRMFIEVGKQVSVDDLIKGMVIQSGNDASVALAEHIARTEEDFAELMNQYAQILGMKDTHFVNATGLPDPTHLTTARDLAILASALIRDFPDFYPWYSEKRFTFNGITQYNRNRLLWQDASVDGLKTGHTTSAGFCLVSSAERNKMRVITVVVGTENANLRITETQKLLNYAFRFFETHKLFESEQRLVDARIWGGDRDILGVGLANELFVTVPRGQYQNLKVETSLPPQLSAPVKQGDTVGQLVINLNDQVVIEKPLIALSTIDEGSFFKKLLDRIKQFFQSIFG